MTKSYMICISLTFSYTIGVICGICRKKSDINTCFYAKNTIKKTAHKAVKKSELIQIAPTSLL